MDVSRTGSVPYQATMHYNAPDRIAVRFERAGAPVESISIGKINYGSTGGSPPRFFMAPSADPFAEGVLTILKNLKTAQVASVSEGRFSVTLPGPPPVSAEVTTAGGFISEITLHHHADTAIYRFSDFGTAPPVTAPSQGQIATSNITAPDGSPVPRCNKDGLPAGADLCIK